ncbi:MAG TPA: hypothetical protein VGO22_03135 [Pseudorhizobium sp.]|jgi:hypothetical protein|nr:hypothetical protein [Pseudorhizobium sp.]
MSTYNQFLEARALSEVLLLKHAAEGVRHSDPERLERNAERMFERLAAHMGFRVEKIAAPVKTGEAA